MNEQEIKLANEYMNYLFNSKAPIKARTRTINIWDEERGNRYVNWLAFNLAMFAYFDTDKFTEEQREIIHNFQKSVEDDDGHDRYYDFYGNSLINMHGTLKNITP